MVVGNINKVHGIKGELSVIPTTDFPLLRFSHAGRRWVRSRVRGKEMISEVELVSGREHPSQKTWIIRLAGIEEVEQAKQFVGSTLLVKEQERPFDLEEGEFYTPDLVGMSVLLQETGRLVGVVANVFNYGASDLLQVKLCSTDKDDSSSDTDIQFGSGQMVWVPFVEEIVPEVYLDKKEMYITPPKGLLELNLRNDVRSKKERRQMEWKERKKLQNNLNAAKKKLSELHQDHLLGGLRTGDRSQKTFLAKQIASLKFKLFQHALLSIHKPLNRFDLPDFIHSNSAILQKNALNIASDSLSSEFQDNDIPKYELYNEGHRQLLDSKTAVVLVINTKKGSQTDAETIRTPQTKFSCIQELTCVFKEHLKVKEGISIPLILICPADEMKSCQEYMLGRGYCGLDSENVWFLEEEKLPIVSKSADPKILTNSLYEIIQEPIGSGGVFISLSSNGILDKLMEIGVQYVQICSLGERCKAEVAGNPLFLGLVKSRGADMAININTMQGGKVVEEMEEEFNIIFTMKHLDKICKSIDKLQFSAVEEQRAHVKKAEVEGKLIEQVHPIPDEPNSYRFYSSIYSALSNCSLDGICTMRVLWDE